MSEVELPPLPQALYPLEGCPVNWQRQPQIMQQGISSLPRVMGYTDEQMLAYARAAVLAERERCAKIAAEMDHGMGEIAAEIRKG